MLTDLFGPEIAAQLSPPKVYVHMALLFYVVGFLTRDELILRAQILAGTAFYILYYWFVSDIPLWEAILGSLAIAAANIYSSIIIMYERSTIGMSDDDKELYERFHTLKPGHFRRIMRKSRRWDAEEETVILQQGVAVDKLYFVRNGEVVLGRAGKVARLHSGHFLGELAFLKGTPASATVTVKPGAEVIVWDQKSLKKIMRRSPVISNAIIALFNEDLATKLIASWPDAEDPEDE